MTKNCEHCDEAVTLERQWNYVLGIIKMQMGSLDFGYLKIWASNLGISEDLENAIESSRSSEN